jgi:hypothetical protein
MAASSINQAGVKKTPQAQLESSWRLYVNGY